MGRQPLCADIDGFSLHAGVRVEAHDRKRLEQLCRYITRPALSDQRIQLNAAGQVELKLKTPWRDGTTHLVMSPLEFMQRLAALVPQEPPAQAQAATEAADAADCEVTVAADSLRPRVNLGARACKAARDVLGRGSRCLLRRWTSARCPDQEVVSGLPGACRARRGRLNFLSS